MFFCIKGSSVVALLESTSAKLCYLLNHLLCILFEHDFCELRSELGILQHAKLSEKLQRFFCALRSLAHKKFLHGFVQILGRCEGVE